MAVPVDNGTQIPILLLVLTKKGEKVTRELSFRLAQLAASGFDMSSIIPLPSKASKKKKFLRGSPFPDIAFITS